jgi:predicted permease
MENLVTVATQVAILFALIGVGFVCRKTKLLNDSSVSGLINILLIIVTPCLVIDVFQRPFDPAKMYALSIAFAVSLAAHFIMIALAATFFRRGDDKTRTVFKCATVFSNAGFMGIPLEQAILGDEGVFFGIVYVVIFNLMIWSWGLKTMGGGSGWRKILVNPGTVGLLTGFPLFLCSVKLPEVVGKPIHMLSMLNTPIPMIVIGYYLAGSKFSRVFREPGAWTAGFLRLIVCPLILIAFFYPFRHELDRMMMLALVTAASAPVAAMVSMFAAKYGRDAEISAGLVSITTLLSILTMPPIIALAMAIL